MPRARKVKPNAVTSGVEALATLASDHYELPKPPAHLGQGEMLIAVVEGTAVVVQTVRRPPGHGKTFRVNAVRVGYVARRLAEIESAVGEILDTGMEAGSGAGASALTEEDENVLASGGFETAPLRSEESEPVMRTALEYARLLQSSLSVEQAAALLDVNPSRIRQRLAGEPRTMYGVKEGRAWRVPKFQFAGRKLVPGIGQVIAALPPDLHAVAVQRWFTTPHPDLSADPGEEKPIAPLDWLRTGRSPEVAAELARDL